MSKSHDSLKPRTYDILKNISEFDEEKLTFIRLISLLP